MAFEQKIDSLSGYTHEIDVLNQSLYEDKRQKEDEIQKLKQSNYELFTELRELKKSDEGQKNYSNDNTNKLIEENLKLRNKLEEYEKITIANQNLMEEMN